MKKKKRRKNSLWKPNPLRSFSCEKYATRRFVVLLEFLKVYSKLIELFALSASRKVIGDRRKKNEYRHRVRLLEFVLKIETWKNVFYALLRVFLLWPFLLLMLRRSILFSNSFILTIFFLYLLNWYSYVHLEKEEKGGVCRKVVLRKINLRKINSKVYYPIRMVCKALLLVPMNR